jgi:PAS domain S-box-containing protein
VKSDREVFLGLQYLKGLSKKAKTKRSNSEQKAMMKKSKKKSDAGILRQKAEELLKKKSSKNISQFSEAEKLRLIHELEVHQVELEMQNEELLKAKNQVEVDITEQNLSEKTLAQSNDLLVNLASLVPGVIYQYRLFPDGRSAFPYSSPGMYDIYEVTPEEVREDATPVFRRLHPDDLKRVSESIFESARTLQHFYCEFRVVLPQQGLRWRYCDAVPERMEDTGTLWHGIIYDITDRKQAESSLKQALEWHEAIFEGSRDSIFISDQDSRFVAVNNTACDLTGYSREQLLKMRIPDIHDLPDLDAYKMYHQRIFGGEEILSEAKILRSDGAKIDTEFNNRCVSIAGKLYMHTTARKITERKRAEEALAHEQYLMDAIMNNLPDHIYFKDRSSRFIRINEAQTKFFGLSDPIQAIGKKDSDFFTDEHAKQAYEDEQMIIQTGQSLNIEEKETHLNRPDTWVSTVKLPLRDKEGNIIGTFGISRDITERKLAEEALQESQHLFQTLSQVSPVGIFRTNPDGYTTYVNPKWLELSGLTSEEAFGFGWLNAVHPDDREKLKGNWNSDVQSQRNSIAEYRFIKPDGSIVWVMGNAVSEWINNKINGYIGTITDITDRKLMETALRESEERFRTLYNDAVVGLYRTNSQGEILLANRALVKMLGFQSFDELAAINLNRSGVGTAYQRQKFIDQIEKEGEVKDLEAIWICRDGKEMFVRENAKLIRDTEGKILYYDGTVEDITMRKILEAATIESEQRYRELFLNNPVPTYIFDTESLGFVEVNDATVQRYGYSREEFSSMTLKDIRLPEDIPDLLESVKDLGKDVFHSTSMRHCRKDGTFFPVEITSHSLPEKNGRKTRLVMAIDVTERFIAAEKMKLAKEKAEASDKLKTTFLNNISHEVRTPMNGILGFAEIMSHSDLSEEEKKNSISMLHESIDRLLNTITNYMDISLITSGNMSVNKIDFFPGKVLRKIFDNYKQIGSYKNLELFLSIPEQSDNLLINTDPEIFQKIINHLLNNAIKFTEKGSVNFGFNIHERELEFFVKDTGIGIRKESIQNIFGHFVKEDHGPSKLSEGSGLGLSIAKGMVEILGGNIRVESEIRVGSCFFFTIPLSKDKKIVLSNTSGMEHKKIISEASILVAEDEETNFFYLNVILTRETGAKILHASNGREAIELFKANPGIILILMDIKLPEINGLEATRQIKLINQDVPIIAITAYAMSGDEERILAAGCNGYLSKPITKKSLLEKIAEFI